MRPQRRRRPTSVRPALETCESKVLLSGVSVSTSVDVGSVVSDSSTINNDIAILKLSTPIVFSNSITP
jgi:hypothetical protein